MTQQQIWRVVGLTEQRLFRRLPWEGSPEENQCSLVETLLHYEVEGPTRVPNAASVCLDSVGVRR